MSANKDKSSQEEHLGGGRVRQDANAASRARNKTVMLTPDIAGQVRAQLHGATPADEQVSSKEEEFTDPMSDLLPPISWDEPINKQVAAAQFSTRQVTEHVHYEEEPVEKPVKQEFHAPRAAAPVTPVSAPEMQQKSSTSRRATGEMKVSQPMSASSSSLVEIIASKPSKLVAFLINYDEDEFGSVLEIRHGRWLLTSKPSDQSSEQIVIRDETVSPLHAIIRVTADGKVQVLDQLSEHGTGIIRIGATDEIELAGSMESLQHGDTIRFGKKKFVVCLIPSSAR